MSEQAANIAVVEPSPPAEDVEAMATALNAQPGFWTLVKEDYIVNGREWTRPGFRAMFM